MLRVCKLLFTIILLPLFTLAQSNYKPGLIVNLKGDTIHGFVDYQDWEYNPKSINFKLALSGSAQQYAPGEIAYFQVAQLEGYRSYTGPISMDATNINRISTGKDTSSVTTTVFLKLEQDGKFVTLLSYTDDIKKRYFIAEKTDNKPIELVYRIYNSADPNKSNKTVTEYKYVGQLTYLASKYGSNSDDFRTRIENSAYDVDIVDIVSRINHTTKKRAFSSKKSSFSWTAGISSGLSSITPPGYDGNITFRNISVQNSYLPRIFLGLNFYTNPDVGRLVFRAEIGISPNAYKTYFYNYYNLGQDKQSYLTLNQNTLSIVPQVLYNVYNTDRLKVYLNAGISFNFSSYSNNALHDGYYGGTYSNYIPVAGGWTSIPLSAGVTLNNKLGISLTYTPPAIFAQLDYKYTSAQLGVSYTFGRK